MELSTQMISEKTAHVALPFRFGTAQVTQISTARSGKSRKRKENSELRPRELIVWSEPTIARWDADDTSQTPETTFRTRSVSSCAFLAHSCAQPFRSSLTLARKSARRESVSWWACARCASWAHPTEVVPDSIGPDPFVVRREVTQSKHPWRGGRRHDNWGLVTRPVAVSRKIAHLRAKENSPDE